MITPKSYTQQELLLIWSKATIVPGVNPTFRRKDVCGAWIDWLAYGNRDSNTGWEVDHVFPLSKGGAHHIKSRQVGPLHALIKSYRNSAKSTANTRNGLRYRCYVTDSANLPCQRFNSPNILSSKSSGLDRKMAFAFLMQY